MKVFTKQPNDVLDYDIVLTDWLPDGDEVNAATVTTDPGITVDSRRIFADRVKLWISGGQSGESYKVSTLVSTEAGRVKEVDFIISVAEV